MIFIFCQYSIESIFIFYHRKSNIFCFHFHLGPDQRNISNAIFCSWMAAGNILGFSAGASGKWTKYNFFFNYIFLIYMYIICEIGGSYLLNCFLSCIFFQTFSYFIDGIMTLQNDCGRMCSQIDINGVKNLACNKFWRLT